MVRETVAGKCLIMTFEFLLTCWITSETNVRQVLTDSLAGALEDYQDEFEEDEINDFIQLRHKRTGSDFGENDGVTTHHRIIGFSVELPEEIVPDDTIDDTIIENFIKNLSESDLEFHIVKFEDPLLQAELAKRAAEIFVLEMKLRRVLSLIYLHAYQDKEATFDLLCDEIVNPSGKAKPDMEQMKSATENQFFHLTFSQYINLNQRIELKLPDILQSIRNTEEYDTFRTEILRVPVEQEEDAEFLASLKDLMDPIERMRNCVAHNHRPTKSINDNYPDARSRLEERLNEYLEKWKSQQ